VYLDSTADHFFIDDDELRTIASMTLTLFRSLIERKAFKRLTNAPMASLATAVVAPEPLPPAVTGRLELVSSVAVPEVDVPYYLNFDYTDFIPV
jgi:hypothetical protein